MQCFLYSYIRKGELKMWKFITVPAPSAPSNVFASMRTVWNESRNILVYNNNSDRPLFYQK